MGFSGGIGSSILLDMVWQRYVEDADEKSSSAKRRPAVWRKMRVAYVEQCAAYSNVSSGFLLLKLCCS